MDFRKAVVTVYIMAGIFSMQSHKAVSAYLTSKQMFPFDFAEQYCYQSIPASTKHQTDIDVMLHHQCNYAILYIKY